MELSKEQSREIIARRVAKEFGEGDVITLGIVCRQKLQIISPLICMLCFSPKTACSALGAAICPALTTRW